MPSPFVSNSPRRRRRRWPWVLAALAVLGAGAALAVYLIFFQEEGDFSNPEAEFQTEPKPPPKKQQKPERFKWPVYGYTADRARFLDQDVPPPTKRLWTFKKSNGLIEFQPILANGTLFFVNNNGAAWAVDAKTGKKRWRRSAVTWPE